MRPIYINLDSVAPGYISSPIIVDQYVAPGNIVATLIVNVASTSVTAVLEFTTDDVFDPSTILVWQPFTATPFNVNGQVVINGAGFAQAAFAYAPKAIRVRVIATTGSPNLAIQVIQLGIAST